MHRLRHDGETVASLFSTIVQSTPLASARSIPTLTAAGQPRLAGRSINVVPSGAESRTRGTPIPGELLSTRISISGAGFIAARDLSAAAVSVGRPQSTTTAAVFTVSEAKTMQFWQHRASHRAQPI